YALALGRLIARNRRRYGGYIVHTGMVMLFVAFAGMAFKTETEASLRPGESASIKSPYGWTYRLTHLGISQYDALNRQVTAATLDVSRDGKRLGVLTTEKRQHVDALGRPTFQPSTEVGIRSDLREDLYVVLGGVVNGTEQAVFRFTINPLVWWVWYGGMIVALGGLIVMWPGGSPAGRPLEPVTAADNDAAIQAIEKQIHCTCGCNQDVYTCRTTDFTCTTSPAMHRRVVALAQAGKTGPQILDAFVRENGIAILMAPPKRGLNLIGYVVPPVVLIVAAGILALVMRRWTRTAATDPVPAQPVAPAGTSEELERLRGELDRLWV